MVKRYKFDWNATKAAIKEEEAKKSTKSFGDDRFWKLEIDKETKKGSAIIRFLPDVEGTLFKKHFSHWFTYVDETGKKRWYTDKCATTVGQDCPVCEKNKELFDSPYDSDKDVGRERKRKIHYTSNIEIVKDPAHPEFNGMVKLFDYGPQVYGKYHLAMFGKEMTDEERAEAVEMGVEIAEEALFVPGDFEEGANFFYRSTLKESVGQQKWNTYETSKFQPQSDIRPALEGKEWEAAIAAIMDQTCLLGEFVDPKKFPHETTVRTKLGSLLGAKTTTEKEVVGTNRVQELNDGDAEGSEDPEMESLAIETVDQDDEAFIAALDLDN